MTTNVTFDPTAAPDPIPTGKARILELPNKPNGQLMRYLIMIEQAVLQFPKTKRGLRLSRTFTPT